MSFLYVQLNKLVNQIEMYSNCRLKFPMPYRIQSTHVKPEAYNISNLHETDKYPRNQNTHPLLFSNSKL